MYLRFVGGQFQGGEFPLKANREVTIGRGSEHDMVLDEDMVSRTHARILTFDGKVVVKDDNSTNGTLVNGERISERTLKNGDQILIGQSVLEFISEGRVKKAPAAAKPAKRPVADTMVANVKFLSGKLSGTTTSFFDLVADVQKTQATGAFTIKHGAEGTGVLIFDKGRLARVSLALPSKNALELPARKAFLRILLWKVGRYKFDLAESVSNNTAEFMDLEALLEDAKNELEMFEAFSQYLPTPDTALKLVVPMNSKLSELSAEALDTLQLVINHSQIRRVVDRGYASDFEIYQDILYLLQNGYVLQT